MSRICLALSEFYWLVSVYDISVATLGVAIPRRVAWIVRRYRAIRCHTEHYVGGRRCVDRHKVAWIGATVWTTGRVAWIGRRCRSVRSVRVARGHAPNGTYFFS